MRVVCVTNKVEKGLFDIIFFVASCFFGFKRKQKMWYINFVYIFEFGGNCGERVSGAALQLW